LDTDRAPSQWAITNERLKGLLLDRQARVTFLAAENSQAEPSSEAESAAGRLSVLPKRWIVERTFAWIGRCRRRNYETTTQSSEALTDLIVIYLDGVQFGPYHVICAVGVDTQGEKHVLGFREGAT